jgi:hypothetical protein
VTTAPEVIDDAAGSDARSDWELIVDGVMGGRSTGTLRREPVAGRPAVHLQGEVSLENNGGFVQMALDLRSDGGVVDAGAWHGLALDVRGNDEIYNLHLRTADVVRPWQSYRRSFRATPVWTTVHLAFTEFTPHRLDAPLDVRRLRRVGVVAIGRAFTADVAVAGLRFYARPDRG